MKNPLTPISLSAQRLRRKYADRFNDKVFEECTQTIIDHVDLIRNLVNEFSSFARMPKPAMEQSNILETLNEAIFLQKVAWPDIEFVQEFPAKPLMGSFDKRLMSLNSCIIASSLGAWDPRSDAPLVQAREMAAASA